MENNNNINPEEQQSQEGTQQINPENSTMQGEAQQVNPENSTMQGETQPVNQESNPVSQNPVASQQNTDYSNNNNNGNSQTQYEEFLYGQIPYEIKRWNWGAFMLNIIWGFGNRSYMPLITLIPSILYSICFVVESYGLGLFFLLSQLVLCIICGVKGNEWAWKRNQYNSVEEFMKIQATWNRGGFVYFIMMVALIAIYIIFILMAMGSTFMHL